MQQEFLLLLFLAHFFLPPFSFLLIYSKNSCKGKLRNGEKNSKLAYFKPISQNSGIQKWMALLLVEKICQFTCYWLTMVCVNHLMCKSGTKNKPHDCFVSPTKTKENKKRERGVHNTTLK
jgi:hypothetical protein